MGNTPGKQVQYVQSNGNASGLKAIASVAVFITLITAAFAPYLFSRQELTAMKAEFDRKLEVQAITHEKRVDYLKELIDRDLANVRKDVTHVEQLFSNEQISERLSNLEEYKYQHDAYVNRINSHQNTTDDWIVNILSLLFKKVYGEELCVEETLSGQGHTTTQGM